MLIDEVMTRYPACVRVGTTVRRAAELLTASGIGMLMVLDDRDGFVGVLTEVDLLAAVLPDAEEIRAAGNSVDDAFTEFVRKGRAVADRPVDTLVTQDPVTVARGVEVAAAAVVLLDRKLSRLPVLDGRTVVGSVSRADLCRAVLAHAAGGPAPVDGAAPDAGAGSGNRQAGTASPRSGTAPAGAARPASAGPDVARRAARPTTGTRAAAIAPDAAAAQAAARLATARARAARPGPTAGVPRA